MALKPDRAHYASDISFFMTAVAERGGIVTISTGGSGAAMDQSAAVVAYAANPSGKTPVGVLMSEVVNNDLTRQHRNWHKEEVQVNGKVTIWDDCVVVTNMFAPSLTITAGDRAYVTVSGLITNVDFGAAASPQVGMFLSGKNEDGYAKLRIRPSHARS